MFEYVPAALAELVSGTSLLYLAGGVLIGLIFGVIPGLGGSQVLALLLPLTIVLEPAQAIILLLGASSAASQGGAVSAILLNTPGTPQNTASTFDGYELTKRGEGARALGAAAAAGIIGSVVGIIVLVTLLPLGRWLVLQFSYADYFALAVFGLLAVALATASGSILRGMMSGLVGLLVSCIGISVTTGDLRYTFGSTFLFDGLGIVPVLVGLFAVSEGIRLLANKGRVAGSNVAPTSNSLTLAISGALSTLKYWTITVRAALIGTLVGIVPGVGGTVANFLAYGWAAKSAGKDGTFGKGDIRGVIAPEAANNGKEGGALLPTLIFGIPGGVETAVLLGALTVHGLQPGPRMILDTPQLVLLLLLVGVAANALASFGSFGLGPVAGRLAQMPSRLLATLLIVVSLTGAYLTQSGVIGDAFVALIFGLLGYFMMRGGYSRVMFTIGFVLGPMMERSLFQSLQVSGGSDFVTRPVSLVLLSLSVLLIVFTVVRKVRAARGASDKAATDLADTEPGAPELASPSVVARIDLGFLVIFGFFALAIIGVGDFRAQSLPQGYAVVGLVLAAVAVWASRGAWSWRGSGPKGVTPSGGPEIEALEDRSSIAGSSTALATMVRTRRLRMPEGTVAVQTAGVIAGTVFCILLIGLPVWLAIVIVGGALGLAVGQRGKLLVGSVLILAGCFWFLTNVILGLPI